MKDQLIFDVTDANTILDSDSIGAYLRSSDGTLLTHTTDGASERLDVNTELGKAEDSAHVSGDIGAMALGVRNDAGTAFGADGDYVPLSMDADGALRVNAVVNVDALSDYAEDSAHTSGDIGGFVLGVRMDDVDGANTALLAGTEGDYQSFFTNIKGELHVRDNDSVDLLATIDADTGSIDSTLTLLSKAEDSIHISGDQGIMGLGVRNDAGTPLAADGDYIPFQMNLDGSLQVHVESSAELTVNDAALADTAILSSVNTLAIASTAETVVASNLALRKYLSIYNNDNRKMYIGASGVTSANGFPVSPKSYIELRAGVGVDVFFNSPKASHEIRVLELS